MFLFSVLKAKKQRKHLQLPIPTTHPIFHLAVGGIVIFTFIVPIKAFYAWDTVYLGQAENHSK